MHISEALVIRNAGGRAADALRTLEVMGTIGVIDLIVVVHHSGKRLSPRLLSFQTA
jgi:carbonic anhydrase